MEEKFVDIIQNLEEKWRVGKPNLIAQPEDIMIRCPIHGMIKLDWYQKYIIDQPFFQRLRGISQLGFSNLIYPGAIHTRFEHSIGVSHLSEIVFNVLKENKPILKEFNIELTYSDLIEVKIAGLLHDIGHLPLSHSSEIIFNRVKSERNKISQIKNEIYSEHDIDASPHEILSAWLVSSNYIQEILKDIEYLEGELRADEIKINPNNVKKMILGLPPTDPKKTFLSNIIHGEIDVDRIDYLLRDAHHTGVPHGQVDLTYLLSTLCLIPQNEKENILKIGIMKKGLPSVLALLLSRATMYPTVYLHHTSRIAEEMYLRALFHAIKEYKFESLSLLNYNNTQIIEYLRGLSGIPKQLIERIYRRDLYKRAISYNFNSEIINTQISKNKFTLVLQLDPEILDYNFYNDFTDLIQLEKMIATELKLQNETVIFNISNIPKILKYNNSYNFYVKEQEDDVFTPVKDNSFLISAIHMEKFYNWEIQICCPEDNKKDLQDYLKKYPPFSILKSRNLDIIEF